MELRLGLPATTDRQESSNACPALGCATAVSPPFVRLEEALQRFEREAVPGICATGRYRCRYFTWGKGPPLLFLHGLGDLARSYVPVISMLADSFQCIAYEQPAGGGDGAKLNRYSHADLVQDLFALLDELGLRQSYVFGTSFGSTIALAAMRAQPERIPRAILAGGFAQRQLSVAETLLARLVRRLPGTLRLVPFRKLIGKHALGSYALSRPELFEFLLRNTSRPPLRAMGRRALMIKQIDLRALLPALRQPVLLLCGEFDAVVRRDCEEVLLQGLPHCTRVELPDCGHMAHYSHPEVVAELVRRFLTPPPR